jgi:hypothetical protein
MVLKKSGFWGDANDFLMTSLPKQLLQTGLRKMCVRQKTA